MTPLPLRRNGDIIALLPLMKLMADKNKAPTKMFVAKEMLPLLEGVSYVAPVTEAAEAGEVQAAIFHRGLIPTTLPNNFAELAWHRLGHKFDAAAPLEFDRRDLQRESALAKALFKTKKPKLLLKLHGVSSPLDGAEAVLAGFQSEFGKTAEIVVLDDLKLDWIYDMIGLMDRAACLVTVDTVSLWLAHASKCPHVALVHPNEYRSSPTRGNCLLRVFYPEMKGRWPDIVEAINGTITS